MSRGRATRSLADLQAEQQAAERDRRAREPRLETLPDTGAFLPPHRPLREAVRRA